MSLRSLKASWTIVVGTLTSSRTKVVGSLASFQSIFIGKSSLFGRFSLVVKRHYGQ